MPYIHCNIQTGLSAEKKQELVLELSKAVHETLGSPMPYVHVGITEIPGNEFVESGHVNLQYST